MTDKQHSFTTPPNALNALADLLGDIIDQLTVVELFSRGGSVSKRFLQEGAERAVCVAEDPPDEKIEMDGLIWLPMDPLEFLQEQRVQDVGLIYSTPPHDTEFNKEVLTLLPDSPIVAQNCVVILEEATWSHTRLDDYGRFSSIETYRFDDVHIAVTQMIETPAE